LVPGLSYLQTSTTMKATLTIIAAILASVVGYSQEIHRDLKDFDKIIVSPKINLVLVKGDEESIRIEYHGVRHPENIIIKQTGRKVHVYLDRAKIYDIGVRRDNMMGRKERYRAATITAYVTYKELRVIETRGEGNVTCDSPIEAKRLKVKAYGETDIRLSHVEAATVKARLYGANTLEIAEGDAGHVSYKVYGENQIDTRGLKAVTSSTTIYGEGKLMLFSTDEVRVNSFGDPSLIVSGSPVISKGIIIGNAKIRQY
jgi:hypothetical protein